VLKYVHGPGVDEALVADDGTALSYYHADGLGSVVRNTNATGAVILSRQYDAWGNLQVDASEPGYGFTGREWNPEIGLYYYRARYYDPKVGRFISEDPIRLRGGLNLYRYVRNGPVSRWDPFGLAECCERCPSGVWYGGGASGGFGYGVFSWPTVVQTSVVRVTCLGKPTLFADIMTACGGTPAPIAFYAGAGVDFVVCHAQCKKDLSGLSAGGTGQGMFGIGVGVTATTGSSTCISAGPGVGAGAGFGAIGCTAGEL
jgi:RHS repeat-associated protein